jgi:hypothetical protein
MSLRYFHIFFIGASSVLALLGAAWTMQNGKPLIWTVACFSSSAALDLYLVWFVRKSKGLNS